MGKYSNLFIGIIVFAIGFYIMEMYNSVIEQVGEIPDFFPFNLELIATYVQNIMLGIGALLIAVGLIRIGVMVFKKYREKKRIESIGEIDEEEKIEGNIEEKSDPSKEPESEKNVDEEEQHYERAPSRTDKRERRKRRRELRRKRNNHNH